MRGRDLRVGLARLALAVMAMLVAAGPASANFLLRIEQQGSNVQVTGSGSFDTGGFSGAYYYPGTPDPALIPGAGLALLNPTGGVISVMTGAADFWLFNPGADFVGPTAFGNGGGTFYSDNALGDQIGLWALSGVLALPAGYNPNDPITSSMTIADSTIMGLGLSLGTRVWLLGDGLAQSFTVQITLGDAAVIPEPSGWLLLGVGLAGLGLLGRHRAGRD